MPDVSYNERSWAIDLIAHIKDRVRSDNRAIRDAGGEQTIRSEGGNLFPDVLLFGDQSRAVILQGWELKLPNTSIDDNEFYPNATKKATALGLSSFVLWNVKCARLYIFNRQLGQYIRSKQWPTLDHVSDRGSVLRNRGDWEKLADRIILDLNDLFENGELEGRPFIDSYRTGAIQGLILDNAEEVAQSLRRAEIENVSLRAEVALWWDSHKNEYDDTSGGRHMVLAKANIYNWIGKFLFAHILQSRDSRVAVITQITDIISPSDALEKFREISRNCNFWTVFSDSVGLSVIPESPWNQLVQFNKLLTDLRISSIDQAQLSIVLEIVAETTVRKVRGQYATPTPLARLMAAIALRNIASDRVLDPCCGSGTIARAVLERKMDMDISPSEAAASIFVGDLDPQATQIAALAMVRPSLMHIPLRIFRGDIFSLNPELKIEFRHPSDGHSFVEPLGYFDAVVSNLPFVSQEGRSRYRSSIDEVNEFLKNDMVQLPGSADLAAYLPFVLHSLLSERGRLVIIMPNAWLSTEWGNAFYELILRYYVIKSVITSGAGRWFQNSKVVTNLLVLEKRQPCGESNETVKFVVLNRPLEEVADSIESTEVTAAQIELGNAQDDSMSIQSVPRSELDRSREHGFNRNAHFVNCGWTQELPLIALNKLCKINRGERRGWNRMFYPADGHGIEQEYIQPILKSSTEIFGLITSASNHAFCCSVSIENLEKMNHTGALSWIRRFEVETNNNHKPLPEVLKVSENMEWYEMRADSMTELVMSMNFGERLFVARLTPPAFVDQRLIRLNPLDKNIDIDLLHALLNSAISLFYIEGIGFGRGEGALDLTSRRIKTAMQILDPSYLNHDQALAIKRAFKPLLTRKITPIMTECSLQDRQYFDDKVIEAFGLSVRRNHIYERLLRLNAIRLAATEESYK